MKEKGGFFITALKGAGKLLPGTRLKTFVYLNCIAKVRKLSRKTIMSFYRQEHVYDVLKEFRKNYKGKFSILEFGVADGYSFTKKLYAVRYLKMEEQVMLHGFDTFAGLPPEMDEADRSLVVGDGFEEGHYLGRYDALLEYCRKKYKNFALHQGLFEETITDDFLKTLTEWPPILIWIDCDYYSSTKMIFEKIIPYIPSGCVIYFDDIYFNFSSRFTGEMKAVWEINQGEFGEGIELVPDTELSLDSNRIYRFINTNMERGYEMINKVEKDPVRYRGDDSPFP